MLTIRSDTLIERGQKLREALKPLRGSEHISFQICRAGVPNGIALAIRGGGVENKAASYRDIRFPSYAALIRCHYHELWRTIGNGASYLLEQACLHSYITDLAKEPPGETELVMIHCEPTNSDNVYKRGPHLHVKATTFPPLSKSHILLQFGGTKSICSSVASLDDFLSELVKMIRLEVLDKCGD